MQREIAHFEWMFESQLGFALGFQDFLHQSDSRLRATERSLVTKTTVSVVVNDLHTVYLILFDTSATLPQRPQAYSVSNNAQSLNSLARLNKLWSKGDCSLQNSVRQVRIGQWIPVVLLIRASDDSTAA